MAMLAVLGCLIFAVGLLVYLTDRVASHATLIPAVAALTGAHWFGTAGQWLPSFAHPFAFSLFTVAVLPSRSTPRYGVCAVWCGVNIAFEVGQHPNFSGYLASAVHGAFGTNRLTQALANYFVRGTFDGGDIAAAILGASTAAAVLYLTRSRLEPQHAQ